MILIDREFKRRGWKHTRIMLSVHDSMAFNVSGARSEPGRMVEVYEEIVKPIIERPVPWLDGFRYRHEAKVGSMWDWETQSYEEWKARDYGSRGGAAAS